MKRFLWAFVIMVLLGTVACQKKEKGPEGTERTKFVPEDYNPTNSSFMKTEKGIYYYNNRQRALRYYDFASEKDIYLCNKPECKHDGNAFCVATNARYSHEIHILYNGKIVAPAIEKTDTQYLMKLLVISLDGSQLEDYATMLTIEKTGSMSGMIIRDVNIHRNKVMVSFQVVGTMADVIYYGALLYDLDTGEITSLNPELFSKDNLEIYAVKGYDDYFYYCRDRRKKTEWCRYHIVNKTEENCTPEAEGQFSGDYFQLEDDMFFYRRGAVGLGFYRIGTGKPVLRSFNKEALSEFEKEWEKKYDEGYFENDRTGMVGERIQYWTAADGKYIYHFDKKKCHYTMMSETGEIIEKSCIIPLEIYDHTGEYQTTVNLVDAFAETGYYSNLGADTRSEHIYFDIDLFFYDETVFYVVHELENDRIYRLNRQEMLDGTAKAEFICELRVK